MKIRHLFPELERRDGEVIAAFGNARLVKRLDCRFELRGGSEQDRAEAREWISLFLHEAVIVNVQFLAGKAKDVGAGPRVGL